VTGPATLRETARDVEALCRQELGSRELRDRLGALLSRRLAADAFCFGTMDPSTLLVTDHVVDGIPPATAATAAHNEYLVDDVLKFARLAQGTATTGVLSEVTGGEPGLSPRYRTLLPLIDAEHELRAVFLVDGRCWGNLALYRTGRRPDFSPSDTGLFHRVSATVAAALRTAAHRPVAGPRGESTEAGVLLLDAGGRLLSANPAAQRWLAEMGDGDAASLPIAVLDVAARQRRSVRPARARVRGRSGRWLSVQASPLTGGDGPATTAVVIGPAPVAEVTEILRLAYALTPREHDILEHVISGRPTRAIAGRLHITATTVQDHLKSIFAKTGVRTRGELVARILDGGFDQPKRPGH
jgi:DNA-binding CsgD family transcriptional regulator